MSLRPSFANSLLLHPPVIPCAWCAVQLKVSSAKEAMELQRKASRMRQSASTGANQTSSRSHAIFTVRVCQAVTPTAQL